jgi:tRNA G10  N-methylase Trm11
VINYQENEQSLCTLEMKCLFQLIIDKKWFYSNADIFPSRSVFIKYRISIISTADSVEEIEKYIISSNLSITKFKFSYINIDNNEIDYCFWKRIVARICAALNTTEDHDEPELLLCIIRINDKWIFGSCVKNDNDWKYHECKPNTNSHSLGIRTARAIVNIAIENRLNISIVDPCCGVGTIVIEAASMGLNIKGYEINRKVAASAKENLAFFGVNNAIECNDMHRIRERFDVSIVDIPYGLFTPVSLNDQLEIIRTARRISDKSVIITFEKMDRQITEIGFEITDQCSVSKGRFTRYINVCN